MWVHACTVLRDSLSLLWIKSHYDPQEHPHDSDQVVPFPTEALCGALFLTHLERFCKHERKFDPINHFEMKICLLIYITLFSPKSHKKERLSRICSGPSLQKLMHRNVNFLFNFKYCFSCHVCTFGKKRR